MRVSDSVFLSGPVLKNLSVLHLSGNRLTGLGGLVFRCAPRLMEIYLDRNQIRSLHDSTFSELGFLEIINLSQNKLPALPRRLLERVSSSGLKTFDLENNSVSLMPRPLLLVQTRPALCLPDPQSLALQLCGRLPPQLPKRPGTQRLHTQRAKQHRSCRRLRGVFRSTSPEPTTHHWAGGEWLLSTRSTNPNLSSTPPPQRRPGFQTHSCSSRSRTPSYSSNNLSKTNFQHSNADCSISHHNRLPPARFHQILDLHGNVLGHWDLDRDVLGH